jgi:transposase-like protein
MIKDFAHLSRKYMPRDMFRRKLGAMSLELGYGSIKFLSETFGVSEELVSKGRKEAMEGLAVPPRTSACGAPRLTSILRDIENDIRSIMDPESMADPRLRGPWAYCALTVAEVLERLTGLGYTRLPSPSWVYAWLNSHGYRLRTVKKTIPLKVVDEADAIFDNLHTMRRQALDDDGTAMISIDCKAAVKVGLFARGGKTRVGAEGKDHDFKPDAVVTPFGILDEKAATVDVTMTCGPATPDFMADCIGVWLDKHLHGRGTLLVHLDNGPECSSRRTQFKKRLVELAAERGINIILSCYPPYQSKHNPVVFRGRNTTGYADSRLIPIQGLERLGKGAWRPLAGIMLLSQAAQPLDHVLVPLPNPHGRGGIRHVAAA